MTRETQCDRRRKMSLCRNKPAGRAWSEQAIAWRLIIAHIIAVRAISTAAVQAVGIEPQE